MIKNGWRLLFSPIFNTIYKNLIKSVVTLREKEPDTFKTHPKTKFLASIQNVIFELIPTDPTHPDFHLGNTLGTEYNHWKRVKRHLPPRYRLFFQFKSDHRKRNHSKWIIYAWLNDDKTLRKEGSKSDVYRAFQSLLNKGKIKSEWAELMKETEIKNSLDRGN